MGCVRNMKQETLNLSVPFFVQKTLVMKEMQKIINRFSKGRWLLSVQAL
jgi:hypothetical protein